MGTFETLDRKLNVFGPFRGPTGYDEVVRNVVGCFAASGLQFQLTHHTKWTQVEIDTDPIYTLLEEAKYNTDTLLSFCLPTQSPIAEHNANALYTMFEADKIPQRWAEASWHNDMIFLPNEFCKRIWMEAGIPESVIRIVPLGTNKFVYNQSVEPAPLVIDGQDILKKYSTRFMASFEIIDRKNYQGLLQSWIQAFQGKRDDTCLILKVNNNSVHNIGEIYKTLRKVENKYGHQHAPIFLFNKTLHDAYLPSFYAAATHYISASYGEGADLTALKMLSMGKTIVVPDHTGYQSYCTKDNSYLVSCEKIPAQIPGILQNIYKGSNWFKPNPEEMATLFQKAIKEPKDPNTVVDSIKHLTWKNTALQILEGLREIRERKSATRKFRTEKQIKVTSICKSWNTPCGIAEYTKDLLKGLENKANAAVIGGISTLYKPVLLTTPTKQDIIHIQYEYQFFSPMRLHLLLEAIKQHGAKSVITQHTLSPGLEHNDIIKQADAVIVHSENSWKYAVDTLGYADDKTFILPMGCKPTMKNTKVQINRPTVAFFGFTYFHKGLHKLILSFSELKQTMKDLHLLIIASKPKQDQQNYFEYCKRLIEVMGFGKDDYTWIENYINEDVAVQLLKNASLIVLPYDDYGGIGTSAASHTCLRAGRPLIVSDTCWFKDLDQFIASRYETQGGLTSALKHFLGESYDFSLWTKAINDFVEQNSWSNVAKKHVQLYEALLK